MSKMFYIAESFTSDLSKWQTGKVEDMHQMFKHASSFNSDLSGWDTGKVTNMGSMFYGAVALEQRPPWYARWEEDHGLGYERWWIHGPEAVFRECDFQLCTDDCIYADFVKQDSGVKLLGISFDGYGYCGCPNANMMDENDAKELLAWVNADCDVTDQMRCDRIMARYCTQNKELLWEDALKEYELFVYDE